MRRFKRTTTNSLHGRQEEGRGVTGLLCRKLLAMTKGVTGTRLNHPLTPPAWRGIKHPATSGTPLQRGITRMLHATSLLFMFLFTALFAQTVTLFETDFEAADHGWTMANGTQTNQWHVGTATHAPGGGSRSAYISNDGGVSNVYTSTSRSLVHMYRVISLPEGATDIVLTFDAKCNRV